MAASALLLTAALVDTLVKARPTSEVFGWAGIACLQVCALCGIRHAVVSEARGAADGPWDTPMGRDILDITLKLESRFGIQVPRDDWVKLMEKSEPPDVVAGDLFDFVRGRITAGGIVDAEMDADWIWPMFQRDISDALGVELDEVSKDRRIFRDLGAT